MDKMTDLKCKNCGAKVKKQSNGYYCEHCGSSFLLSKENIESGLQIKNGQIEGCLGCPTAIIIPEGITFIKEGAFRGNKSITSLTLSSSTLIRSS